MWGFLTFLRLFRSSGSLAAQSMCLALKSPALLYLVFFETLLVTQWDWLRWTETVSVSRNKRPFDSKTDIK